MDDSLEKIFRKTSRKEKKIEKSKPRRRHRNSYIRGKFNPIREIIQKNIDNKRKVIEPEKEEIVDDKVESKINEIILYDIEALKLPEVTTLFSDIVLIEEKLASVITVTPPTFKNHLISLLTAQNESNQTENDIKLISNLQSIDILLSLNSIKNILVSTETTPITADPSEILTMKDTLITQFIQISENVNNIIKNCQVLDNVEYHEIDNILQDISKASDLPKLDYSQTGEWISINNVLLDLYNSNQSYIPELPKYTHDTSLFNAIKAFIDCS